MQFFMPDLNTNYKKTFFKNKKTTALKQGGGLLLHSKITAVYCLRVYSPMHEVVPSVVAMAVRMVMAMCRIFCQIDLFSMVLFS